MTPYAILSSAQFKVCSAVVSTGTAHLVSQQAPYIGVPEPTL